MVTEITAKNFYDRIKKEVEPLQEFGCDVKIGQLFFADNRIFTRLEIATEQEKDEVIAALSEILNEFSKQNQFSMNPLRGCLVQDRYDVNICLYATNNEGQRIESNSKLQIAA